MGLFPSVLGVAWMPGELRDGGWEQPPERLGGREDQSGAVGVVTTS